MASARPASDNKVLSTGWSALSLGDEPGFGVGQRLGIGAHNSRQVDGRFRCGNPDGRQREGGTGSGDIRDKFHRVWR
jgi:hypothetical protein